MEKLAATIEIQSILTENTKPIMDEPAKVTDVPNDRVRIVGINEYKKAAQCLAESFLNDAVAQYFLHTDDGGFKGWTPETRVLHNRIYEYITYAHCLKGLVTTIGPDYDSVALWYGLGHFIKNSAKLNRFSNRMPPGKNMDDYYTMFRSGMWRLRYQLSSEGAYRLFQEFLPKLHESKTQALGKDDDNSWYLVYIGTKRGAQRKGYAKALIEMVTDQVSVPPHESLTACVEGSPHVVTAVPVDSS